MEKEAWANMPIPPFLKLFKKIYIPFIQERKEIPIITCCFKNVKEKEF
jgi:hypothetical protein